MTDALLSAADIVIGEGYYPTLLNALISKEAEGQLRFSYVDADTRFVPLDDALDVVEDADAMSLMTYDEAGHPLQVLGIAMQSNGSEPLAPTLLLSMNDDPARKVAV